MGPLAQEPRWREHRQDTTRLSHSLTRLGNKSDLQPSVVEPKELENLAQEIGALFFFVSAFKNLNIDEAFDEMAL